MQSPSDLSRAVGQVDSIMRVGVWRAGPTVGDYKLSHQTGDHNGWLRCDHRALKRDDYRALFIVIGTTFGAPDSTSFLLPNKDADGMTPPLGHVFIYGGRPDKVPSGAYWWD